MAELLRLFISATHDLDAERAAIGRALAGLPLEIGMEIRRTPSAGASLETMHELVANVDRFYFLLGEDISAPAGAEWFLAWKLERSVLALRRGGRHTPAALEFLRNAPVEWAAFAGAADAARLVALDVIRLLHHPANRYGLSVAEFERLAAHGALLRRRQGAPQPAPEPGGAEGGGVLLDMGRREPLQGVALDE